MRGENEARYITCFRPTQQKNGTLEKKIIELEKRKDYSAVINEKMASGAADNIEIPARAAVNIG